MTNGPKQSSGSHENNAEVLKKILKPPEEGQQPKAVAFVKFQGRHLSEPELFIVWIVGLLIASLLGRWQHACRCPMRGARSLVRDAVPLQITISHDFRSMYSLRILPFYSGGLHDAKVPPQP